MDFQKAQESMSSKDDIASKAAFYAKSLKFVSSRGYLDSSINDENFRDDIDYWIKKESDLKGKTHLGNRSFICIQAATFKELTDDFLGLDGVVHQWCMKHAGPR